MDGNCLFRALALSDLVRPTQRDMQEHLRRFLLTRKQLNDLVHTTNGHSYAETTLGSYTKSWDAINGAGYAPVKGDRRLFLSWGAGNGSDLLAAHAYSGNTPITCIGTEVDKVPALAASANIDAYNDYCSASGITAANAAVMHVEASLIAQMKGVRYLWSFEGPRPTQEDKILDYEQSIFTTAFATKDVDVIRSSHLSAAVLARLGIDTSQHRMITVMMTTPATTAASAARFKIYIWLRITGKNSTTSPELRHSTIRQMDPIVARVAEMAITRTQQVPAKGRFSIVPTRPMILVSHGSEKVYPMATLLDNSCKARYVRACCVVHACAARYFC